MLLSQMMGAQNNMQAFLEPDVDLLNQQKGVSVIDANSSAYKSHVIEVNNGGNGTTDLLNIRRNQLLAGTALAVGQGVSAFYNSQAQQKKFEMEASNYEYQATTAGLNADAARRQMYNARYMGEWQAMQRGLADAQATANIRAQNASSGVRMNEGSKREVEYSQRQAAELNQIAIQQSTTNQAMEAYRREANLRAQQTALQGQAEAARILSNSSNPFLAGLTSFASSATQLMIGYYTNVRATNIQAQILSNGVF